MVKKKKFPRSIRGLVKLPFVDKSLDLMRKYFTTEDYYPDTNITSWPPERLRESHAYWTQNWVYLINVVSQIRAEMKDLRRSREEAFRKLYMHYKDNGYTNDMARYKAEARKTVSNLDKELDGKESALDITENLLQSCDKYRTLCSRDQSLRDKEMEVMFRGRGGQGK